MKHSFTFRTHPYTLDLTLKRGAAVVRVDGREIDLPFRDLGGGAFEIELEGRRSIVHTAADGETRWVALAGRVFELQIQAGGRRAGRAGAGQRSGVLRAPMPGLVRAVQAAAGDGVEKGATVMILEAMKMEIRIQAAQDGVIKAVHAAEGEQVERDQVLVEME